jgi:Carboxypeptidase regulatory-like domain/TonB-dependent Receptor Plug Domain
MSAWCRRAGYLLLGVFLVLPVFAQTTGVITGTITDSTSAVIPNAKVVVRNMGTGEERVVQTNTSGFYVANSLPVATYEVEATAAGFKKTSRGNIQLSVADRLAINLSLAIGEVTESIAVTGEAPVVETEKGDVGYAVQTQQMTDLSINGRTYTQLMQLIPGASRTMGDEGGVGFNSARGFAVNGQRPKYSGLSVDGVENTDMGGQSNSFTSPGLETISELRVQAANYSAEYGTAGGTNIIVATRSGTKDFHGAAYEFLRNNDMDARNFFATTIPVLRYNNFGYRIGGPVYIPHLYNKNKDKTFFFWGEECAASARVASSVPLHRLRQCEQGTFPACPAIPVRRSSIRIRRRHSPATLSPPRA